MEEKQYIFEPLNQFDKVYRSQHDKNVKDYLEDLIKKSGVNEQENAETVKQINAQKLKIEANNKVLSKKKGLRGFVTFLVVLFFITAGFFIINAIPDYVIVAEVNQFWSIFIAVAGILVAIGFIILIVKSLNPQIRHFEKIIAEQQKVLNQLLNKAWGQMRTLNDLFDWSMTAELIEKTVPLLDFDPYYRADRADYMRAKYGLNTTLGVDESVEFVQSGQIFGNPFLLLRILDHRLGTKTYTGSLTITWTETVYVNNRAQTVTRTQTLTATISKPCPYYSRRKLVIYCNDAAPDLSFSRDPSKANSMSDKEIAKYVQRNEDDLAKMTRKAIEKGQSFQATSNAEFELLFGALNRNNEIQFRLLFTPLAQREMLAIIKDKKVGFGDDFEFDKRKQVNYIYPKHLQGFDIDASPDNYIHYDLKVIRNNFITYNNEYFRHFYFAMAPLLAIPLYQQYKPIEYIYKDVYPENMANFDHEAHVNNINMARLKHPNSHTENILKTHLIDRDDHLDKVGVTAYGYQTFERVEYVPMRGGDGRVHNVPVHWTEYIPVSKDSSVYIKVNKDLNRPTFNGKVKYSDGWVNNLERLFGSEDNAVVRGKTITFMHNSFTHADNILLDEILKPKD